MEQPIVSKGSVTDGKLALPKEHPYAIWAAAKEWFGSLGLEIDVKAVPAVPADKTTDALAKGSVTDGKPALPKEHPYAIWAAAKEWFGSLGSDNAAPAASMAPMAETTDALVKGSVTDGILSTGTESTTAGKVGAVEQSVGSNAGSKADWGFWGDYPKVTVNGRQYAQIGDRLYTQHAVDRMAPSGFGTAAGATRGDGVGRSISPNFIEDIIRTGTRTDVQSNGVTRSIFTSGSVEIITEDAGRIIVTVNPFKN